MAKAIKRYEEKGILKVEKTPVGVTLELNMEEAEKIKALVFAVVCTDSLEGVYYALKDAGVDSYYRVRSGYPSIGPEAIYLERMR